MTSGDRRKDFDDENQRLQQRRNRFANQTIPNSPLSTIISTNQPLIGTCETLEKGYLRLTSTPHPSTIRPLNILEQAFPFVLKKYQSNHDWSYIISQLKSIRQDLMVQSIRNDFTVLVYEENARLALEMGDRDQFIQCQSQLEILYDNGCNRTHLIEFLIYRLLYSLLLNDTKKVNRILIEIEQLKQTTDNLEITLKFCSALRRKDYFQLFIFYKILPKLACCLVEFFLQIYRQEFLRVLIWGFSSQLTIEFLSDILAYQSQDICREDLRLLGIQIHDQTQTIDCKQSRTSFQEYFSEKSSVRQ